MRHTALVAIVATLAFVAFAFAANFAVTPAAAKEQDRVDKYVQICKGGSKSCEGVICSCCYQGFPHGCYICNADWTDCAWDKGKGATVQGTQAPVTTGGQTLAPQDQGVTGGSTQPFQVEGVVGGQRLVTPHVLQPLGGGEGGAAPQFQQVQPLLKQVQPLTVLQAPPLECWTETNTHTASTRIYLRNTTGQEIARGQHVSWSSGSVADTMKLARSFAAGDEMRVGPPYSAHAVGGDFKCRGWAGPPEAVLAQ